MDDKQAVQLKITEEAARVLNENASTRKRGDFVSELLENLDSQPQAGVLERIEAKLDRLLAQLDA